MSFDQQIKEFGVVRIPGGASDSELAAAIAAEAATRSAADALVQSIALGGTNATTAGAALTNLGAASATNLSTEITNRAAGDLLAGIWAGTETGAANAYVVDLSATVAALAAGLTVRLKIGAGNTNSGASTLNIGDVAASGPKPIQIDAAAVARGKLVAGGIYTFCYDGVATWHLAAGVAGAAGAAGANGAAGENGATGPAGPAPSGTGFVHVTAGVLDTPAALVDGDMPSASNAAAIALKAPIASPTFTGTVTSPATTQTGPLQFTTTQTSAGATISNDWRGSAGQLTRNVPTGGTVNASVNGAVQTSTGTSGMAFPTGQGAPATSVFGLFRDNSSGTNLQAATTGYTLISANGQAAPRTITGGAAGSITPGMVRSEALGVSLANAGTRSVMSPGANATLYSGTVIVVDTTNKRRAAFSVEAGTPTKIEGHAQFVAGAPGASEVGLELSSTTLQINNGSGGALLLTAFPFLA